MSNLGKEPTGFQMVRTEHVTHGRNRCKRDTTRLRLAVEIIDILFFHPRFKKQLQRIPIFRALKPRGKLDIRSASNERLDHLAELLTACVERSMEVENGRSTGGRVTAKIRGASVSAVA